METLKEFEREESSAQEQLKLFESMQFNSFIQAFFVITVLSPKELKTEACPSFGRLLVEEKRFGLLGRIQTLKPDSLSKTAHLF